MLVREAFAQYIFEEIKLKNGAEKTQRNYTTSLNSISEALGDIPIKLLTLGHITRWKMYMDSKGNSPSTIKHQLCHVRSVLRFLKRRGYDVLDYRMIDLPKVIRSKPTYLEYGEVQKVIDATENIRDKAIIACLFSTGCRISELLNLNIEDVQSQEITVLGKGSKYRRVYIDDKAWNYLQMYLESRKDRIPALFVSGQYRRITVSRVQQILHVLEADVGLEKNLTPHVMRHSYATDLMVNGAHIVSVKELLGHSSVSTTQMYLHTTENKLKEDFNKYHSV